MSRLERLFRPRSVAVIGGGSWCENVIGQLQKFGFGGKLWSVHPGRDEIAGLACLRSVDDLPEAPDAAFIGVNRAATVGIVRALAGRGAGGAVCFASGFKEASEELDDAGDLQDALIAVAGEMPVLGPNCYGFVNALDRVAMWPDQHGLVSAERGVAIISQSSNIAINLTMQKRGLPVTHIVTVGNQAKVGLSEIGEYLLEDERVTAIGLYVEGLDDLRAFENFAVEASAAGKPVVALKVGKSEQARAATVSHTASLAGNRAGATALLRRLGIASVDSLPALLETLKLFHVTGPLPHAGIASMSSSGGEASLIADTAIGKKVKFPAPGEKQIAHLRRALGPGVALANPLDYHTYVWGDPETMSNAFAAMMEGDACFGFVILDFPRADRSSPDAWMHVIDAVESAMAKSGKPIGILSSLPETMPEDIALDLMSRGIVPLCGFDEALQAIEAATAPARWIPPDPVFFRESPNAATTLSEFESKALIENYGITVPKRHQADSIEGVLAAAPAIGFPVVLKGSGFAHKTEAGAVRVNLKDECALNAAASAMNSRSFLVEEMIGSAITELLVGIVHDRAHGYVLTLAAGGVLTELLEDSASLIVPADAEEIGNALDTLRISAILNGYRGGPSCDRQAIIRTVLALQKLVMTEPVTEAEINPLMCGADFAVAADALIRIRTQEGRME